MGSALCKPRVAAKGKSMAYEPLAGEPLAGDADPSKPAKKPVDFEAVHKRLEARKAEDKRRLDEERAKYAAAAAEEHARQVDARVAEVLKAIDVDADKFDRAITRKGCWSHHFRDTGSRTRVGCFEWTFDDLMLGTGSGFRPSFKQKLNEAVRPFRVIVFKSALHNDGHQVLIFPHS